MKALETRKHKTNLTNILIDIYKDGSLGSILGFKGGTAAMLFHNLPRFSTDLDFDLIPTYKRDSEEIKRVIDTITEMLTAKYTLKDQSEKYNTLFWLISYGPKLSNIKIEISTRDNPYNHYELKQLYGVSIKTLELGDMIAHKMVALLERESIANRDLFDIHYFLGTPYTNEINYDIIKYRTEMSPKDFYQHLYSFVSKISHHSVLSGLGEVLDSSQKDWAKAKLITELLTLIKKQEDLF